MLLIRGFGAICSVRYRNCLAAGRSLLTLTTSVLIGITPLVLACVQHKVQAAHPVGATSKSQAREEAKRAIPWRQLTLQQRRSVQSVCKKSNIYRRLPVRVIDCDPNIFSFLMQRPEVVADTWRTLGVSKFKVQRQGEQTYYAEDGMGTTGQFSFLSAEWGAKAFNRVLIFAEGSFQGKPLPRPIRARSVMLLRTGSVVETNGRTYVTAQLDTFLDIENVGVELVAKTIRPLITRVADHNFTETLTFVSNFSRAAERNPRGVENFSQRLDAVDGATRDELIKLCYAAGESLKAGQDDSKKVASLAPAETKPSTE
ncbi:MAG: hypothetical protein MK161_05315 [Pirellulales bacterium]|nr:hypothetical protein [Pirellulales bacterium]